MHGVHDRNGVFHGEGVPVGEQEFGVRVRGCELVDAVGGEELAFEMFIDGQDLVVEEVSKVVAHFLGGRNVFFGGCGIGELPHNGKKFLAVVCARFDAVCQEVLLGVFQEVVVLVESRPEHGVVFCLFADAPLPF